MPHDRISIWRRNPFKRALAVAYTDGVIDSKQLHELCARFDRVPAPWLMDKQGFPIKQFKGKPIRSFIRVVLQNIRKLTG